MNTFDTSLLVGRFQTLHLGHMSLIDMGLKLFNRMLILVGSAQESVTERNPYDVIPEWK